MGASGLAIAPRRHFDRLALLLSAGHLLAFVDRAKLAGAMPAIRRQVAMGDTAAGWILGTAFALGYGLAVLATAALARRGAPWFWRLPAGVALWAAASLATGLAASVPALIAARLLVGMGQALFIPAAISWIVADGDRIGARLRGLATFTAASSLGRSLGLLLIGLALALVGAAGIGIAAAWRWAFALTALPNLFLLVLVAGLRRAGSPSPSPTPSPASDAPGRASALYLLLAIPPVVVTQALAGWLPTLFVLDRAMTPQAAAGWVGGLTLVGGAGGQLGAGWLMARRRDWQAAAPLVVVGAMAAALPGLLLVGWAHGALGAAAGVLLTDLALGLAIFAGLFGWQRLTPASRRVTANGLFFAAVTVAGVGMGPLLTGMVADHGGALRVALMTVAAGCAAVAALLALAVQPLYRRHARA